MNIDRSVSEEVLSYFEDIVGMDDAKTKLQLLHDAWKFQDIRKESGFEESIIKNVNFLICGGRGTGKTILAETVARYIQDNVFESECKTLSFNSRLLVDSGILDQIKEVINENRIIVILENIDEFVSDEDINDSIRRNTVLSITDIMKTGGIDRVFILSGGKRGIDLLKYYDPTIENYIFDTIQIGNYSTDELWDMMKIIARKNQLHVDEVCGPIIKDKLQTQMLVDGFLNGAIVERYLNDAVKQMASDFFFYGKDNSDENLAKIDEKSIDFLDSSDQLQVYLDRLNSLIGLEEVKKIVTKQIQMMKISLRNEQLGISEKKNQTLHMVFNGEPGTGKTTVAEIIGNIYCELGILPNGKQGVKVVSRADLVGQYVGETAQRVKKICEEADGGVLFIDEAYSLVNSMNDSFGHEAVDTLIQEMENRRNSLMVILAGYTSEMESFLKANKGFRSRIPEQNIITFEDYNLDELFEIFQLIVQSDGYCIDTHSISNDMIKSFISVQSKKPGFGNARGVRNLVQRVEETVKIRVYNNELESDKDPSIRRYTNLERKLVKREDIQEVSSGCDKDDESIEDLLNKLQSLVGLKGVKEQVNDIVRAVEYSNLLKERGIETKNNVKTMHLIFSGNPGTGKSTVATLLGKIYRKLGVLKKDSFVLAKRENLVGQYQGNTAAMVAAKVADADGGILFIDEAYQLCLDERDMFGMEAIGTLLSLVEEKRDSLMVILAGYEENMDEFLSTNSGLRSRFPRTIKFEDYSIDELMTIFRYMMENERNMKMNECVLEKAKALIEKRKKDNGKEFGNARGVRNIVDEIIIRQNSRIASSKDKIKEYSDQDLFTVIEEDVMDE
ncbi:MAG: AAA family ATPase [Lachnospiraceae bacterium]|nr:AAA family ATPase [Lachnospiraceae bacterium]